mmetsp:Transcript_109003/g.338547  ORF Transcript_109003/g.338547 Transcript_109003/m.338547 type:complete len:201 (-) Transcript_109003:23-625(-)
MASIAVTVPVAAFTSPWNPPRRAAAWPATPRLAPAPGRLRSLPVSSSAVGPASSAASAARVSSTSSTSSFGSVAAPRRRAAGGGGTAGPGPPEGPPRRQSSAPLTAASSACSWRTAASRSSKEGRCRARAGLAWCTAAATDSLRTHSSLRAVARSACCRLRQAEPRAAAGADESAMAGPRLPRKRWAGLARCVLAPSPTA